MRVVGSQTSIGVLVVDAFRYGQCEVCGVADNERREREDHGQRSMIRGCPYIGYSDEISRKVVWFFGRRERQPKEPIASIVVSWN